MGYQVAIRQKLRTEHNSKFAYPGATYHRAICNLHGGRALTPELVAQSRPTVPLWPRTPRQRKRLWAELAFGLESNPVQSAAPSGWDREKIVVHSSKTEHHEGKAERIVPLFLELRPYLEAALDEFLAGFDPEASRLSDQPVISRYRDKNANPRT